MDQMSERIVVGLWMISLLAVVLEPREAIAVQRERLARALVLIPKARS